MYQISLPLRLWPYLYKNPDNFLPETWDFSGMVEDTRLLYDVGFTLSMESHYPQWKAGSEFMAIREKSLK